MSKLKTLSVSLIPAVLSLCLAGCVADGLNTVKEVPPDREAEERNVRRALDDFFTAADRKDWQAIDTLLAGDFEFYSDDLMKLDRKQFLDAMRGDEMEIAKLDLKDVSVLLSEDADMAFVRYGVDLESSIHGAAYNMSSIETVVYRKEEGRWKMLHNHASIRKL